MTLQDLDDGLKALVNSNANHYEYPTELLKNKNQFDEKHKYLVFDKLYNDGFCLRSFALHGGISKESDPIYAINYDGFLFYKNGGYKRHRIKTIIKNYVQIMNAIIVLMATIFAAWYAVFEIWKYYYGYVPPLR